MCLDHRFPMSGTTNCIASCQAIIGSRIMLFSEHLQWPVKGHAVFQAAWQSGSIVLLIFVQFTSLSLMKLLTLLTCMPCWHSLQNFVCFFSWIIVQSVIFNISTIMKWTFYMRLVMWTVYRCHNHGHTSSCWDNHSHPTNGNVWMLFNAKQTASIITEILPTLWS